MSSGKNELRPVDGRTLLESISEGVCVLNAEGRTTFANRAAAELTWYEPEDLVGETHHGLLRHSGADGTPYSIENCPLCGAFREGRAHQTSNEVFWRKDGAMLPVGYTSDPVIEDGAPAGAIVIFRDVSERRRASEEMEQRFKNLLEKSSEGLALTESGKVFDANKSFLEIFGYSYEEAVGMESRAFVVPEDRGLVGRKISSEGMESYEARGLRKDGTTFPMQVQPRNFPYGGREVRMTSVLDTTERKKAEEELHRQRNLYEGILTAQSQLGEGFVIVDDQSVTYANEAFCEISGYDPEEIQSMPSFLQLISEEDRADLLERRQRRMQTGEDDTNYETGLRRKDGKRVDVEVAFKVFENEDSPRFMVIVRDITRRKRAEENLRKQERRLRQLIEQAADALFVHDLRGDIVDINRQACETLGYTREELLSMRVADIEQNIDTGSLEGLWNEVLTGGPVTIEGNYSRKDGTTFPVEVRIGFFEAEEGPLMLAVARDITGRKRAEEELRRSELSLIEAQRIASFGNWEYDLKEDDARWSEELYRIFGHESQAFVPNYKTFFEAVHPEDRESVREAAQTALASGSGSGIDFRIVRPGGELRTVHARYEVVRIASGRSRKLVGTVHDVTERRRAEEALRQSEERFRALIQNASDIVTILEADGTIRYESPAIVRMLGYTPEELVGTNAFDHIHPDDLDAVMLTFAEALEEDLPTASAEIRFRHKDGSWRYLEAVGTNLLDEPAVRGIVVNSRDVTERKQYEEELRRSNAELEQFAYVASHDLQEPLRMVSSYTQLLARRYRDQLDQDAEEFVGYAVDGAERMQRLINDLLSYSRVGTRGRELAPIELSTAVEAAMANLRLAIEESGAQITLDTLPAVTGDRPQLSQVFQNLIGNAIKFRKKDEPPEVHIGAERKGKEWLISVRDNGIGMDSQYADRVFVIFQRLHGREDYEGTGIGLAICKRIIERHGGKIWVESAPGEGSTFYFTIPSSIKDE